MAQGLWQRATQLSRTWYGTAMLLAALGCGIGISTFFIAALQGITFFAVVGGLIGLFGATGLFILQRFRSQFELKEVKISLAGNDALFVVNARYRKAAWQLFVEIMTRVATQRLPSEEGCLREALTSIYSLFQTTRNLLKEMEPTPTTQGNTVEMLALEMLNSHLRPFLTRWHPKLAAFERERPSSFDHNWSESNQCRVELDRLRDSLASYAKSFGQLANVRQLDRFFDGLIVLPQAPSNLQYMTPMVTEERINNAG